jgi:hypothetical protein
VFGVVAETEPDGVVDHRDVVELGWVDEPDVGGLVAGRDRAADYVTGEVLGVTGGPAAELSRATRRSATTSLGPAEQLPSQHLMIPCPDNAQETLGLFPHRRWLDDQHAPPSELDPMG